METNYSHDVNTLILICGYGVCLFMGLVCALLLWKIFTNQIDLTKVVSESNGDASISRFQLLVFTMMVAISLFILVVKNWKFPEVPEGVLGLLGISASTYAVGKGIQFSQPQTLVSPEQRAEALQMAQQMSDTGAQVVMTPGAVVSGGAKPAERVSAAPQDGSPE